MLRAHLQALWQKAESSLSAVKAQQARLFDAAGVAAHDLKKIAAAGDPKALQRSLALQHHEVAVAHMANDGVGEALRSIAQTHTALQSQLVVAAQHQNATVAVEVRALEHKVALQQQEIAAAQRAHAAQQQSLTAAEQLLTAVMKALAAQSSNFGHSNSSSNTTANSTAASDSAAAARALAFSPALSAFGFVMSVRQMCVFAAIIPPLLSWGPALEIESMPWRTALAAYCVCAVIDECLLLLQLMPQSMRRQYKKAWVLRYEKTMISQLVQGWRMFTDRVVIN
jgi:hypothetical protein